MLTLFRRLAKECLGDKMRIFLGKRNIPPHNGRMFSFAAFLLLPATITHSNGTILGNNNRKWESHVKLSIACSPFATAIPINGF